MASRRTPKKRAKRKASKKRKPRSSDATHERVAAVSMRRMKLVDLNPAPYNPRRIKPEALEGLKASVKRFGMLEPIVYNERTGHVVGGHKRLETLRAQGYTATDVLVADLVLKEEKAANVTLNNPAIAGEFDDGLPDILDELRDMDGFTDLRLDVLDITGMLPPNLDDPNQPRLDTTNPVICPHCGLDIAARGSVKPDTPSPGSAVERLEIKPKKLVKVLRECLSDDLLKKEYRGKPFPSGHCYVATEALLHLLGGETYQGVVDGVSHWWLKLDGKWLDPTADQFPHPVDYAAGKRRSPLTKAPSKRTVELIRRIHGKLA